ncbi:hypothetical protein CN311_28015 [Mesorhizobium sanjuanii]|uniref:Uncharacterized protein n=1 Tax=Mesorhizobium sanjuanii TaxID=2037900 RepID=A0A2A6F8P2_9HYPH|nr:hypothetical protein CN311_28015 [Mesorhizobium sanjuanii]
MRLTPEPPPVLERIMRKLKVLSNLLASNKNQGRADHLPARKPAPGNGDAKRLLVGRLLWEFYRTMLPFRRGLIQGA